MVTFKITTARAGEGIRLKIYHLLGRKHSDNKEVVGESSLFRSLNHGDRVRAEVGEARNA